MYFTSSNPYFAACFLKKERDGFSKKNSPSLGLAGRRDGIPALLQLLPDENQAVRRAAAASLTQLGWRPDDKTDSVSAASYAVAMGYWNRIESYGADAIKPILSFLVDNAWEQRRQPTEVLTKIGEPAVEPLIEALASTDRGLTWTRPDPAEPGACEPGRRAVRRNARSGRRGALRRDPSPRSKLVEQHPDPQEDVAPEQVTLSSRERRQRREARRPDEIAVCGMGWPGSRNHQATAEKQQDYSTKHAENKRKCCFHNSSQAVFTSVVSEKAQTDSRGRNKNRRKHSSPGPRSPGRLPPCRRNRPTSR